MKPVWILFSISIALEIVTTCYMKQLDGLRRPGLLLAVIAGIAISWGLFAACLKTLPVGPAYALWSAFGILFITLLSMGMYGQKPDLPAVIGMGLITLGVIVLFSFSKMEIH
jgi:small multidrug resistance pump